MTPEKWGPDPIEAPDDDRLVVVHINTLKALRGLMDLADLYPGVLPVMQQVLRVASIDPHGRILIGIHVVRDLEGGA